MVCQDDERENRKGISLSSLAWNNSNGWKAWSVHPPSFRSPSSTFFTILQWLFNTAKNELLKSAQHQKDVSKINEKVYQGPQSMANISQVSMVSGDFANEWFYQRHVRQRLRSLRQSEKSYWSRPTDPFADVLVYSKYKNLPLLLLASVCYLFDWADLISPFELSFLPLFCSDLVSFSCTRNLKHSGPT